MARAFILRLPHGLVPLPWVMAQSYDLNLLTSHTVLSQGLEEVKGRSGSVRHGDELPVPIRVWWPHPSHLPIQGCLDVSTFPPDQRWNISKKEGEERSIFPHSLNNALKKLWSKSFSPSFFFPDKFCSLSTNMRFFKPYTHAMIYLLFPFNASD